jgi:hypothetical protein
VASKSTAEQLGRLPTGIPGLRRIVLDSLTALERVASTHDRRIREFKITDHGMKVGEPIREAHGLVVPGHARRVLKEVSTS